MDKKIVAIVAVVLVAAAGIGAFALLGNNGGDNEKNITLSNAGDELIGGVYDNVIIASSVGDGNILIKNVKILKNLVIHGGGSHSITIQGCEVQGEVSVEKENGEDVRVVADDCNIKVVNANSNVILDCQGQGGFNDVNVNNCNITVNPDANVSNISANGETNITVQGEVDSLKSTGTTTISGNGNIENAEVSGNVTVDSQTVNAITINDETNLNVNGNSPVTIDVCTEKKIAVVAQNSENVDIGSSDGTSVNITVNDAAVEHVHKYVKHEGLNPTCTEAGYLAYVDCSECEYTTKVVIKAHGHDLQHVIEGVPANCTEAGALAHNHCEFCGKDFVVEQNDVIRILTPEELVIQPKGHHLTLQPGVEATCTEPGIIDIYFCDTCRTDFADAEGKTEVQNFEIPPKGHALGTKHNHRDATCTEDGNIEYFECANGCGYHINANLGTCENVVIEALGHEFGNPLPEVPATCTEDGLKGHFSCARCNNIYILEENDLIETTPEALVIPATGHKVTHVDAKPAECAVYGMVEHYLCSVCGWCFADEQMTVRLSQNDLYVSPIGHDWVFLAVPENGGCKLIATCNNNHEHDHTDVYAQGHPVEETGPTCTEAGVQTWILYFQIDDEAFNAIAVDTAELPALGHDWAVDFLWSNDHTSCRYHATCVRGCQIEGDAVVEDRSVEPTCTRPGENGKVASVTLDGEEYTDLYGETIPALGHQWGEVDYDLYMVNGVFECVAHAVCTRDNTHEHTEYGNITTDGHPTCTEGADVNILATFREFEDYEDHAHMDALGHDIIRHDALAPTCTEPGYDAYDSCSRCEYSTLEPIAPLGHDMTDWAVIREATLTSGGIRERHCTRCDLSETEVFDYGEDGLFQVTVFGGFVTVFGESENPAQTTVRVPAGTEVVVTYTGDDFGMWIDSTGGYPAGETFMVLVDQDCWFTAHDLSVDYEFSSWTTIREPTCTEPGYRNRTGSVDGVVVITDFWAIPALGHHIVEGSWVVDLEETCTEKGVGHYTCDRCHGIRSEVIPAKGHHLGEWEIIDPALGGHIGTKVAHCIDCEYEENRPYISAIIPTGNIAVVYDREDTSAGPDSTNMHDEWHVSYIGEDGKQRYMFYIFFDQSAKWEMATHSFFYYVDEGPNSPVYVAHTTTGPSDINRWFLAHWAYNNSWGIGTYVDSYEEFLYFIDNNYLGHSNGKYGTTMYDMYYEYQNDFNRYGPEYFKYLGDGTINGTPVKTYADRSDWHFYSVDENNCTLGYGNYTYVYLNNDRQSIKSITEIDCDPYEYMLQFVPLPELPESISDVHYFAVNMDSLGHYVWFEDDDFAVPVSGPANGLYGINGLDNARFYTVIPENYHLVSWQVRDLDGQWVNVPTTYTAPSTYYPNGYYLLDRNVFGSTHIDDMFTYLAQHPEKGRFAAYHTPEFSDIWFRVVVEPDPYTVTVVTHDCYMLNDGEKITEAGFFNDRGVYIYADSRIGYDVTFTVLIDGQEYNDWWGYGDECDFYTPEEGRHVIDVTARYIESEEKKVTVSFTSTTGGYIVSFDDLTSPAEVPAYTSLYFEAVSEPGYIFYGWFVKIEGMEDGGDEFEAMSLYSEEPFPEFGWWSGDDPEWDVYIQDGDYEITAVFLPVKPSDLLTVTVSKDDEGVQTGYAVYSGLSLSSLMVPTYSDVELIFNPNTYEVSWWNDVYDNSYFNASDSYVYVYQDIVIRGIYEKDVRFFTLSYSSNGGEGEMGSEVVCEFDARLNIASNEFTKFGHYFSGWNTKADGSGTSYAAGKSVTLTESITLYAIWAPNTMWIDFNVVTTNNQGLSRDVAKMVSGFDRKVTYGSTYNIPEYFEYLYGYSFVEWNTKADGTGQSYNIGDPVQYSEERLVLYSILTPKTYHIEFNNNSSKATGGFIGFDYTMPMGHSSSTVGLPIDLAGERPQLKNFRCNYYMPNADGSGDSIITLGNTDSIFFNNLAEYCDTTGVDSITLYVKWSGVYTYIEYYDGERKYYTPGSGFTPSLTENTTFRVWSSFSGSYDGYMLDPNGTRAEFRDNEYVSVSKVLDSIEDGILKLYVHKI